MATGIEEMEAELKVEFGELDFTLTVSDVPFGITLDEHYREVGKVYRRCWKGRMVLPDGTHSDAMSMLLEGHTKQEEINAIQAITIAVLRRLARFYQKEKS